MKYPTYIMEAVRQNLGLGKDDISEDKRIEAMSHDLILDCVSTWNNLINYGSTIRRWITDIYGVKLQ